MSSYYSNSEWLDDELRRVPVPEGMLARLRQIAAGGTDDELDAQLAAVPLPAGLVERLQAVVAESQIDEALVDVPLPVGFASRLSDAVDREVLAEELNDVPLPQRLLERLRSIPLRRPARWATPLALAASLLLLLGGGYLGLSAYFGRAPGILETAATDPNAPTGDALRHDELPGADPAGDDPTDDDPTDDGGATLIVDLDNPPVAPDERMPADVAPDVIPPPELLADDDPPRRVLPPEPPVNPLQGTAPGDLRDVFTSDHVGDDLPELDTVAARRTGGATLPTVREFDRLTLARTGFFPFVEPAKHTSLAISQPPLVLRTTSLDLLQDRLERGARLADVGVRTEEFLAAMPYGFSLPAAGDLGLRTAAGPAPLAGDRVRLLQIGVQAGPAFALPRTPTRLVVAVDVSGSMRWRHRLEMVRTALADLLARLHGDDRLTLIAISDRAEVLIAAAGPADGDKIRAAIDQLQPQHGANLGAGLQDACAVAAEKTTDEPGKSQRRLVLLTDAELPAVPAAAQALHTMVERTAAAGVAMTIGHLSGQTPVDEAWASLATAARGTCHGIDHLDALRQLLRESLTGQSQLIARRASLRVTFNPRAVAQYRLLGHEPAGDLRSSSTQTTLYGEQTVTALYQIVLTGQETSYVAAAELTWLDAATGKVRTQTARISRVQFAASFASSPLSLQAAVIAADAAEILRTTQHANIPWTPQNLSGAAFRNLDRVVALAADAHPRLRETPAFRRFIQTLQQLRTGGTQ